MPAFGNNGLVDLENKCKKTVYKLVDSDGKVLASSYDKNEIENKKTLITQSVGNAPSIVESEVKCL